jgi:hypothetical protein
LFIYYAALLFIWIGPVLEGGLGQNGYGYGYGYMDLATATVLDGGYVRGFDWTTRRLGLFFEVLLYWDVFGFDSRFRFWCGWLVYFWICWAAMLDMAGSHSAKGSATLQHGAV